jgi:hypothetical protein
MKCRIILIVAIAGFLAAGLFQIQAQQQQQQQQPEPPEKSSKENPDQEPGKAPTLPNPVLDVKGLMQTFNGPVYRRLHAILQNQPTTEKQWNDIQFDALQVAEIANLIVIRKVPQKIVPTVMEHATELQKAGLALDKAARSHNAQETRQSYQHVVETCNACHKALAPGKAPELTP